MVKLRLLSVRKCCFVLLLCIIHVAIGIPGSSFTGMQLFTMERGMQHANSPFLVNNTPDNFGQDLPDEPEEVTQAKNNRRRLRFLNTVSSSQFNISQRIVQEVENLAYAYALYKDVNKTGIYQQQDSFLPAYYNFLFRFVLF